MDLKQLEYILAIEEHGNVSRAAEALYISQSALNQQLLHLEKNLGMKLFHRDKRNMRPTQAGKIYLESAREILKIQKNTYSRLHDLADSTTGELRLGLTWEHGVDMFTELLPEFMQRYPRFSIQMFERTVSQQHQMILSDHLDLGFVMLQKEERIDANYIPICREEMLLAIPRTHPLARLSAPYGQPFNYISLSQFKDDLFSLLFKGSTMRALIDRLFQEAGFKPRMLFETSMNQVLQKMVAKGLCCAIFPQSYAHPTDDVACFRLHGNPSWEWCLIFPKGIHPSVACSDLIRQAKRYGYEKEQEFRKRLYTTTITHP
ncbi:MAG: LysR substrate-binding domain-containing protein [Oliverpabstia sp.]